jgi:UDP-N-acetylglucosamine transferase subunit ALG13
LKLFLTVGSMLPFDRLTRALDGWAASHAHAQLFGQVGRGGYRPRHFGSVEMLGPSEYRERILWADLVVSHVGMGTVITTAELGRPLLLMPRVVSLSEVTSDHQAATARWLAGRPGVAVAVDEQALLARLGSVEEWGRPNAMGVASPHLLQTLRDLADRVSAIGR